jgi:aminomethyltransferase
MSKRTPLYDAHVALKGKMIDFGGWELPVQYSGIAQEHTAVRTHAGIFDVSHMGEINVTGEDAIKSVNALITNDLEAIADGQALYTAMCRENGGIVDDLVVYRFSRQRVFICCNAANREKDYAWIKDHIQGAVAEDLGDQYSQIALQGPKAVEILSAFTQTDLSSIQRYWFKEGIVAGVPAIISRTGYTGEDGFELYLPANEGVNVWQALLSHPTPPVPAGLGARDSLRLEMKYSLYGNDIDDETTPLEAGLAWITKLNKTEFIGKEALVKQKEEGVKKTLVAFKMKSRGIARHGYPVVDEAGVQIGVVTSGCPSITLKENIGLAYVPMGQHKIGAKVLIQIRQNIEEAEIVKPPFVVK